MERNIDQPLTELLARWHRWASSPVRAADTLLRDFDALVSRLSPRLRAALGVQARNAACGAQVWSSVRVDPVTARRARRRLLEELRGDEARWFGKRVVQLNERGNRIGESNPNAVLTDHEVSLMLQLREDGYSYGWLALKFECSKSAVQSICNGSRRAQVPARVKEVSS